MGIKFAPKDWVSLGAGLAVLLPVAILVSPAAGIVAAPLTYLGVRLLLGRRTAGQYAVEEHQSAISERIADCRTQIQEIAAFQEDVPKDRGARPLIKRIVEIANRIVDRFAAEPPSLEIVTTLWIILSQANGILALYVQLLRGELRSDQKDTDQTIAKVEGEILPLLGDSLDKLEVNLSRGKMLDMKAAMDTLRTTLELSGLASDHG